MIIHGLALRTRVYRMGGDIDPLCRIRLIDRNSLSLGDDITRVRIEEKERSVLLPFCRTHIHTRQSRREGRETRGIRLLSSSHDGALRCCTDVLLRCV